MPVLNAFIEGAALVVLIGANGAGKSWLMEHELGRVFSGLSPYGAPPRVPARLSAALQRLGGKRGLGARAFALAYDYLYLPRWPNIPAVFGVDNFGATLAPKVCEALVPALVVEAKAHRKTMVVATHNPGVLDGINLGDDTQRLLVVERATRRHHSVHRVQLLDEAEPVRPRLSEAFLRGYLG